MKKYHWLLQVFLIVSWNCHAQNSSFLPQKLGENINSTYNEINPVISPDGKTLFFTRVNHPENKFGIRDSQDIWFSTRADQEGWTEAKPLSVLNIGRYNSILGMSGDGQTIFINGVYNWSKTFFKKRGISASIKIGNSWSEPEGLIIRGYARLNKGLRSSTSINNSGEVLILSFSRSYNRTNNRLYVSTLKKNGLVYRKPQGIKVEMEGSLESPFLANDSVLYFTGKTGKDENFNIYRMVRTTSSWLNWSAPELLNDTINSTGWESDFKTNRKGTYGYFSSTNDAFGGSDIYQVKLIEENPFVLITGRVIQKSNQATINPGLFSIISNNKKIDSLIIDQNLNTFRFKLPLGGKYYINAINPAYLSDSTVVDVSNVREFTEMKADLYVEHLPYVIVHGNLLVKGEEKPIPDSANPQIFINNQRRDSLITEGKYELKLNHGTTYNLQVRANKFEPVPYFLDLSEVDHFQEFNIDLYVNREKMALVTGSIIDQKTMKRIAGSSKLNLKVEGVNAIIVTIDTLSSTYELKLPLGSRYIISANSADYYPIFENIDLRYQSTDVRIYKDLLLAPIEIGQSIRLNNIFFETGKSVLQIESFAELDRVVEFLSGNPEIKIEISGHTDNVGKVTTNLNLSNARAKRVADYIISKGLSPGRITYKGYGMSKPVADNKTKAGRALNRRVEFTILEK